jgi:hypothetical protein
MNPSERRAVSAPALLTARAAMRLERLGQFGDERLGCRGLLEVVDAFVEAA